MPSWMSHGQSYLDDLDPVVRLAASDAFTQACSDSGSVSYSTNGIPGLGSAEGRRAGLSCQRTDMLSGGGDPFVTDADGAVVNTSADAQAYATAALSVAAPSASLERRYARAQAAVLAVRDGFAIVPGGPSEAFNRIQTCLNGSISTNQGNLVVGVSLNCGEETIRRAVSEFIAPGFYIQFGNLVGFGCDDMHDQAHGGATVEARWAASLAYVAGCSPPLDATAAEGGEIGFAAVAPLAQSGGACGSSFNIKLANAYAAGLVIGSAVSINASGNPTAGSLGNLFNYSLSNFGSVNALVAHAPLARYFYGPGETRISIVQHASGARLPLIGAVLLSDSSSIFQGALQQENCSDNVVAKTPIVSTRGHFEEFLFDDPELTAGHTETDYDTSGNVPGLEVGECPEEIVIYVHGFENTVNDAIENFNSAQASLRKNGYVHPVIGFSWDSDVGPLDFDDAKLIAEMNGPKLAQFIADFKCKCPEVKVRLVGHSLGARVILSALQYMDQFQRPVFSLEYMNKYRVQSVALMGAAVDNEEVGKGPNGFGDAIENTVDGEFWNYFNFEDDTLSDFYFLEEGDQALGEDGAEAGINLPKNYHEQDVTSEVGDDHSGYNRHSEDEDANDPGNDGIMDDVKRNWDNE